MENVKNTLKLLTDNVVQADCNARSGSLEYLRKDLNMAYLLAEELSRLLMAQEIVCEAKLRTKSEGGELAPPVATGYPDAADQHAG